MVAGAGRQPKGPTGVGPFGRFWQQAYSNFLEAMEVGPNRRFLRFAAE